MKSARRMISTKRMLRKIDQALSPHRQRAGEAYVAIRLDETDRYKIRRADRPYIRHIWGVYVFARPLAGLRGETYPLYHVENYVEFDARARGKLAVMNDLRLRYAEHPFSYDIGLPGKQVDAYCKRHPERCRNLGPQTKLLSLRDATEFAAGHWMFE